MIHALKISTLKQLYPHIIPYRAHCDGSFELVYEASKVPTTD